ncbi:MAG: hypothetical protein ABL933_13830 [Methyloglobulus sp.]|nr:hypothetical protein [Methyloglobulus sp.]
MLAPIKETFTALYDELETKFETVNQRINSGLNEHIKVAGAADKLRWSR